MFAFLGMVLVTEVRSERSLSFEQEKKAVLLREVHGESYDEIRKKVRNLSGKKPSEWLVRETCHKFSNRKGKRTFKYKNCGRRPWKVTPQIRSHVVRRLRSLRNVCVCTSTTLQREVAKEFTVQLESSTIRRILQKAGFKWLPRSQKPKLSKALKEQRVAFVEAVLKLGPAAVRRKLSLSMDGVVLSCTPKDPVDRENWCKFGDTHMYRKPSESNTPSLAGQDVYGKQVKARQGSAVVGRCRSQRCPGSQVPSTPEEVGWTRVGSSSGQRELSQCH